MQFWRFRPISFLLGYKEALLGVIRPLGVKLCGRGNFELNVWYTSSTVSFGWGTFIPGNPLLASVYHTAWPSS